MSFLCYVALKTVFIHFSQFLGFLFSGPADHLIYNFFFKSVRVAVDISSGKADVSL